MTHSAAQRLYFTLLAEMASGYYTATERFLSFREVMQRWRVSYSTASQALDMLRDSGMLIVHDRSGHYLAPNFRSDACIELARVADDTPLPQLGAAPQRSAHWRTSVMSEQHSGKQIKRISVVVVMNAGVFAAYAQPSDTLLTLCGPSRVIIEEIHRSAAELDIEVTVHQFDSRKTSPQQILDEVLAAKPEGVLIRRIDPYHAAPLANALLKRLIPVVTIMGNCKSTEMVTITLNNIGCGYNAAQALLKLGHRNVAVLTEQNSKARTRDRTNGFIRAVHMHDGCEATKVAVALGNANNDAALRTLLDSGATALFSVSSDAFISMLPLFRKVGLRIPEQMGVIVCSQKAMLTAYDKPVDITWLDFGAVARKAFEILLDFHSGLTPQRCILVNTPVVHSGSVLPLSAQTGNTPEPLNALSA